jgi:hypothetical protein
MRRTLSARGVGDRSPSATAPRPLRAIAATRLWRAKPQSRKDAELSCLRALAPWREKNNADPTTARSKSRSPPNLNRSRRAAEPQSAHLKRDRRGHPDRWHQSGTPSPPLRRHTRQRHPRPLCGSAPLREKNNADPTTARSKSRSPPNPNRSRRAAEPQSAHLKRDRRGHPAVPLGAGRPAHPCVATHVRDTPDLSAALRLCARKTTPTPPPPARRADRRQTRIGRAEPQSRRALTSSAIVGDTQAVGIGAGRPAPRRGDRRRHPRALGTLAPWRDLHHGHASPGPLGELALSPSPKQDAPAEALTSAGALCWRRGRGPQPSTSTTSAPEAFS